MQVTETLVLRLRNDRRSCLRLIANNVGAEVTIGAVGVATLAKPSGNRKRVPPATPEIHAPTRLGACDRDSFRCEGSAPFLRQTEDPPNAESCPAGLTTWSPFDEPD